MSTDICSMIIIIETMATQNAPDATNRSSAKSPIVAALLSWFIPGLGHYYGGVGDRGLFVFLGTVAWYVIMIIGFFLIFGWLMVFVTPLLHIGAGADAYFQVKG